MAYFVKQPKTERKVLSQRSKKPGKLDLLLESQGLYRKRIPRDGNSLFRCIADQTLGSQRYYPLVRNDILAYFWQNQDEVEQIMSQTQCVSADSFMEYMIAKCLGAVRAVYRTNVQLYKEPALDKMNYCYLTDISSGSFQRETRDTIVLSVDAELRWDSVLSHDTMLDMAYCQSLVYKFVYKGVFGLENVEYAVKKMLDKTNKFPAHAVLRDVRESDDMLKVRIVTSGEFCKFEIEKNLKVLVDDAISPFPFKVAKSLDENIYRNVEYDVWDSQKGDRALQLQADLEVGAKCLVYVNDEKYIGYVQHLHLATGKVMVFVEQLGKRQEFPVESVVPIPRHPQRNLRSRLPSRLPLRLPSMGSNKTISSWHRTHYHSNSNCEKTPSLLEKLNQSQSEPLNSNENKNAAAKKAHQEISVLERGQQTFQSSSSVSDSQTTSSYSESNGDAEASPNESGEMGDSHYNNPGPSSHATPVNIAANFSYVMDGSDLPLHDVSTLRYFYNQGIQYTRIMYHSMKGSLMQGGYAAAVKNVMKTTAVPVHAAVLPQIPPGTPMTPITPTEAPLFYHPQFRTPVIGQQYHLPEGQMQHHHLPEGQMQHHHLPEGQMQHHHLPEGQMQHHRLPEGQMQHHHLPEGQMQHHHLPEGQMQHHHLPEGQMQHHQPEGGQIQQYQPEGKILHQDLPEGQMQQQYQHVRQMQHHYLEGQMQQPERQMLQYQHVKQMQQYQPEGKILHQDLPEGQMQQQYQNVRQMQHHYLEGQMQQPEGQMLQYQHVRQMQQYQPEGKILHQDLPEGQMQQQYQHVRQMQQYQPEVPMQQYHPQGPMQQYRSEVQMQLLHSQGQMQPLHSQGQMQLLHSQGQMQPLLSQGQMQSLHSQGQMQPLHSQGQMQQYLPEEQMQPHHPEGHIQQYNPEGQIQQNHSDVPTQTYNQEGAVLVGSKWIGPYPHYPQYYIAATPSATANVIPQWPAAAVNVYPHSP